MQTPQKRMGRPKTENPKSNRIVIRLDNNSFDVLKKYCDKFSVTKAEAVRKGIEKLEVDLK